MSPSAPEGSGAGRVLVLNTWPFMYPIGKGGGSPIEADLFEALLGAGYEVDLVAPKSDAPTDFPEGPRFRVHRIRDSRVTRGGRLSKAAWMVEFTARMLITALRIGRKGHPRVVYGIGGHTIRAAALAGKLLRRPSVGVIEGTFLYPMLGDREALRDNFEEVLAFRAPVTRLSVLNDGTRGDRVAEALGVPPERLVFRMHGIDRDGCAAAAADPASRAEFGIPEGGPLIVTASRLAAWKRVDRAIRAMPLVLERHPDAVLAIAGDGPAEAELRALVEELEIGGSVIFTGGLDRASTLRLVVASDIYCSFYDYSNVGLALLEALTCGAAVVVGDSGATTETVEDGINGLVVGADDVEGAADAISRLIDDPELRAELAGNAKRLAEERLMSTEERMDVEMEMVRELAGASRGAR